MTGAQTWDNLRQLAALAMSDCHAPGVQGSLRRLLRAFARLVTPITFSDVH